MPKYMIKLWDRADREVFFQHDPETKPLTKVNRPPARQGELSGMAGTMGQGGLMAQDQAQRKDKQ